MNTMNTGEIARLQAKTPEQRFLRVLEQEFHQPPRVAQAVLEEAQACLLGHSDLLQPGQMRVLLACRAAAASQALPATATREVVWTVDAGREDLHVRQQAGRQELRRVRLQRLLDEALAQDAAATQEDLARALQVSVRTIKRDCAILEGRGIYLPTRGNLHGIGRGQTHKAQIVGRWLQGETYDQIAQHTHHCPASIQRYVQAFARIVHLHQQELSAPQVALLVQQSLYLVQEYLAIYRTHASPECRTRLEEQLQRFQAARPQKKRAS
jgi:hypothetical protein